MPLKALITGASSGIGLVFAEKLARQGYTLTLLARREQRLQEIINGFEQDQHQNNHQNYHRALVADLTKPADTERVCAVIAAGQYDLLINNAGAGIYKPFHDTDLSEIETITALNCDAVVKLSDAFLKSAKAGDALINVASMVAFTPYPPAAVYGATKAFVVSLSESLWHEYRARGIYVMALCPGATDTNFFIAADVNRETHPPRSYMQSPEAVVDAGLRALKKRRQPTVIPGWHNKIFAVLMRLMSRKTLVKAVGKFST